MQHDQFIGQVQERTQLAARGEAERASRAVLETLGERIPDGLADKLASQLPHEIGEHLRRTEAPDGTGTGERFDPREFVGRVATRAGVDELEAAFLARKVVEVVDEAAGGMVSGKVSAALPDDLRDLLLAGNRGT